MDKRYDYRVVEKEIQELWEKEKPYLCDIKNATFTIDTPPPTVSGSLHIGHIFSYTQTDLLARYKRMQGEIVFYPMGFDDNGLATERFVEKKHKVRGHNLTRSEFIKLCLQESKEMGIQFSELWKSMGLSIDWTKVYSTISDHARKVSQESFIDLYKKKLVYKQEEPALYCTTCRTTVAQAELDDAQVKSTFNDISFTGPEGEELVVATTRPELLPACVALFFHPDDERYQNLKEKNARAPVFGHEVPILTDDKVDKDKGTGLVMCCTFGDQTDVEWYKKYELPFLQAVGRDGKWTDATGPLAGLRVQDARKKVLELLEEAGVLKEQKKITHSVGVHERCKNEIEYLVLNQWFVKILDNKEKFLALADEISWHPEFMKARYKDWVTNLKWDWCISRQRFYGVQFPVWYCNKCNEVLLADEKDLPVDPMEQKFSGKCDKCGGTEFIPETDVMDTWNTSSLTPQINGADIPMSLRPQAHDIIRTWTFYTIVKSFYHNNTVPWKNIALSGYVVANGREKISKSKGNAPTDPVNLLKMYPADAIRYWAANGRLGVDTLFSENQFKIGQRLLTKLWNAFRFLKDQIDDYKKNTSPELDDLNRWLLHHFYKSVVLYKKHFDAYEHTAALEVVERFFWHIFCDNYLELIKGQKENEGTRYTLYEVGFGILQLFAPFVPHVTEKLYQIFYRDNGKNSCLHATILDEKRYACNYDLQAEVIDKLVEIVGIVRKLKSEHQLSLKTELENLTIYCADKTLLEQLEKQKTILSGVTKAKKIEFTDAKIIIGLHDENGVWSAEVMV
jgi:valyl-tRNA synthetase